MMPASSADARWEVLPVMRTPSGAKASSMALVRVAGATTAPASPTPRKSTPPCGSVSKCSISMVGISLPWAPDSP